MELNGNEHYAVLEWRRQRATWRQRCLLDETSFG